MGQYNSASKPPPLETLVITVPISDAKLREVKTKFKTVHYFASGEGVSKEIAREADVWFTRWQGFPLDLGIEDLPNTRILQLTSAGANHALKHPALQSPEAQKQIAICSASGIHVITIPQWIVGAIINVYQNFHTASLIARTEKRWPKRYELSLRYGYGTGHEQPPPPGSDFFQVGLQQIRGKTIGFLGYGNIAREAARLLKTFNATVIAANTSGKKSVLDGYIIPGTGDKEGNLPDAWYSTKDEKSFKEFFSRSDIVVAALPSTPETHYLLKDEHFQALPKDALFVNVGRGDLVESDVLLRALDAKDGLIGVALDVTDPEPLPDNHPLLSHPRAVITPHNSSDFADYFNEAVNLLVANIERVRGGGEPFNRVDPKRGY